MNLKILKNSLTTHQRILQILFATSTLLTSHLSFASPDVTKIINGAAPSVVTVQGIQWVTIKVPEQYKGIEKDPVYQVFSKAFSEEDSKITADNKPVVKKRKQASGFIISPKGLIITNYQTVIDAHEIYVQLTDKRRLKATLLRSEPKRDLAILKIAASNLPALALATKVTEGEWVLAIGANKAGASSGSVLSSTSRANQDLITDVEISQINTGGPLLNIQGEVLAMNSSLLRTSSGVTRHVLVNHLLTQQDLQAKLPQSWKKLGFTAKNLTQIQQKKLGLADATGAWVDSVSSNSIASKSGLQQDDVIMALESQRVIDTSDLSALRDFLAQNNSVNLTIFRAGELKKLRFSIPKSNNTFDNTNVYSWQKLGLKVRALNNVQKSTLNVESGVQITAVDKNARDIGLQVGDFILSINQQILKNAEQLNNTAKNLERGSALIAYIVQKDLRQFVEIIVE